MRNKLLAEKVKLTAQAHDIRRSSANLSGDDLRDAQDDHKWIMGRISQINDYLRNH